MHCKLTPANIATLRPPTMLQYVVLARLGQNPEDTLVGEYMCVCVCVHVCMCACACIIQLHGYY